MCILVHMSKTVYIHNATDKFVKRELNRIVTKNRLTGTKILVSETEDIDAYDFGLKWQTVCLNHATVCNHPTQQLARSHAARPDWCGYCQDLIYKGETTDEECLEAVGTFYDYYDAFTKEYLGTAGASVVRRYLWQRRIVVDQPAGEVLAIGPEVRS